MSFSPGDRIAAALPDDGRPVPDVVVEPDADHLARAVASALVARLAAAQAVHDTATVVLTGGGIGTAVLERAAALAAEPERERVDWTAVDVWWGDERFVPAGSEERNETGARRALLDPVGVPAERVHAMPASDAGFAEPEEAAAWYAEQLAAAAPEGAALPRVDVLLLGMGPEGHVASIFPDSPAASDDRLVVAVRDCPKPPPTRISLGFAAINAAEEIWLLVSGEGKAPAVAAALRAGAGPQQLPAAGVHGRRATRWLLDAAAAGELDAAR
ncbi:6-phosphogluconolactonase [Geodermatophilus sabuli]|uniref:6-phosphogluconolactonase n=1 Tax=Geodermatophilus sabuli TaxID=1564158 RepID=A0A285ED02_9ACTN|nr:6-phosphogluconolactonase [Geodermatophilus sabuli]MBB3085624.1 6-phosphogluconolactonase [Geodermatophilus sabuli]SNX95956.1 6-phosphogluconolactonase [Geodermatophilus sabuli]